MEATQGALICLECWFEYWSLPLYPIKCEASLFSMDFHQANLQLQLLLFNSRLRFNPLQLFLRVTFETKFFFKFPMTNPGAGANKSFVAPAPEKMLGSTAPGSGFPALSLTSLTTGTTKTNDYYNLRC